jgi:hypothetical protein
MNPILLLPYAQDELRRKQGGGRTPDPLVPVTTELRGSLVSQLTTLAAAAGERRASASNPMPVKITLRPKALAKSNRPYKLLNAAALPPVAAEQPGELVVGGTRDRLMALAAAILTGSSKDDQFYISTFEGFASWSLQDVFGVADVDAAAAIIEEARRRDAYIKVTLFPWFAATVSRIATPQGAIGQDMDSGGGELLPAYRQALGLDIRTANVSRQRPVVYLPPTAEVSVERLQQISSIRAVSIAPTYTAIDFGPQSFREIEDVQAERLDLPSAEAPVVGVLDTGVDGPAAAGVVGQAQYDIGSDRDPWHGTFVSGLVMSSRPINDDDARFPADSARIFDGQVLPAAGISEALLFERVSEVVKAHPEVRVWNCSFGAPVDDPREYGTFAQDIDALSDELGVLFVQAAGNYESLRAWPPTVPSALRDHLASPAEAVRSVTVGARAHLGGFVDVGMPSSYSRRGPNFALHVKPDLSHWAGDVTAGRVLGGAGVKSILPSGSFAESIGTSFSTPIVSATAANVWDLLELGGSTQTRPELVKGLLAHAALLHDRTPVEPQFRSYFGWGTPPSSSDVLGADAGTFTTVHEVILTPGSDWYKQPFPVPPELITSQGKFHGEVLLTLSYAPPVNPAFGSEAVRTDVSGAFGYFAAGSDNRPRFHSITPQEVVGSYWEADQIADGKWSPLKTYRKSYPQGTGRGTWALRLSLTERVTDESRQEQRVFAIVSFRSLVPGQDIYSSGLAEVNRLGYASREMIPGTRLRLDGQA